ncbi:hypothetical protein OIU83_00375 [Flavobacterium sp. LS1R49]|uniref:Uncharacterized protein n=1 Tax=Flavobacterium shii TaxID=2987687 RepID=A0A9X2Z8X1_9FLAO|nr:hypothetical protein [Flavobacterium shii]MCV9926094.1 hypothetical protein [Flavobacterium shii]
MKYKKYLIPVLLAILFYVVFISSFLINIWGYIVDKNYYIPKESNLFIFNATVMQKGSSDAWVYGEDYNNYYFNAGLKTEDIIWISKVDMKSCPNFEPTNIKTWCGAEIPHEKIKN